METLGKFIDDYFCRLTNMPQPQKKQPRREYSAESEEDSTTTTIEVGLLELINSKLPILEILHQDIKDLKTSLEFNQSQIESLQK